MSYQQQQQQLIIPVASSNCGLVEGKSGFNIYRGILNYHIIFFQELSKSGREYPYFHFIANEYKKENGGGAKQKASELHIAIDNRYFTLVNRVFTNDRIQIAHIKCIENGQDIILINCHIPQRLEKRDYLIRILKSFISEMDALGYSVIIGGDFNTDYQKVSEIGTKFSNFRLDKTTPSGSKEIDFITTSKHFNFINYFVDSRAELYQTGNHFCLKALLKLNQQSTNSRIGHTKSLDEIYHHCENESYQYSITTSTLKSKVIQNYRNDKTTSKTPHLPPNNIFVNTLPPLQYKKQNQKVLRIQFTDGMKAFLDSYHSDDELRSIYNSHLKGKLDIRTFKSFVSNKGERSRDNTKIIIIDALDFLNN